MNESIWRKRKSGENYVFMDLKKKTRLMALTLEENTLHRKLMLFVHQLRQKVFEVATTEILSFGYCLHSAS